MYVMNRYKGNCSIADTISECPQGNKWQMAVKDISESNEADGMHEEAGKSCVYTYTEIIVRNKNPVNVMFTCKIGNHYKST